MKGDPGTNYTIAEGISALSRGADTYYTASVNHALAPAASFHVNCGEWATSFIATLQHSANDSDFTDEADTSYGNTVSQTFIAADADNIHCPNPRRQYTRVKVVTGGTCVFGVTNVSGPLRTVDQG
ncbi:MAG: hypothetical protein Q8O94_01210 [bacterium]|nr:hypothetical protein [bacterium]